jgi:hypothetical protein
MIPPDAVAIDAVGPVAGTVERSAFAGDRAELTVDANGAPLRVRVADRDAPAVGATVRLTIDAKRVLVYPTAGA